MSNLNNNTPISFSLVMQSSIKIFKKQFKHLFILAFIQCAIRQLSSNYISSKVYIDAVNKNFKIDDPLIISIVVIAAIMIYCFIHSMLLIIAYKNSDSKPEINKISQYILRLMPYLLLNFLIYASLTTLGVAFYIVPGIIVMTIFLIYEPIILFENIFSPRCLYESFLKVKQFIGVAFLIVLFWFFLQIPTFIIQSIGSSISYSTLYGIDQAAEIFINAITLAIFITTQISFYSQINININQSKDQINQKSQKKPTVSK